MSVPKLGTINGTQTITAAISGGLNVLGITGINLGNGQTLTLSGPSGTEFIFNDSGNVTLNSGKILLTRGLTASDVVFNITGTGTIQTSGGLGNESVLTGIFIDPNSIALSPGKVVGELIGGGSIDLASGAEVIGSPASSVPEPASLTLFGSLFLVGLVAKKKFKRTA